MASIVRLALLVEFHIKGTANLTKDLLLPWFSTVVEIGVAIIGSCLPCLLPLYRRIRYGSPDSRPSRGYGYGSKSGSRGVLPASNTHSKLSSGNHTTHRAFSANDDGGPFERLSTVHTKASSAEDEVPFAQPAVHLNNYRVKTSVGHVLRIKAVGSDDEIPLEGINVQREIVVQRSPSKAGSWLDDGRT